uniref:Uncharacterized protein n=1 Tax=Acrobeloides nanus TaxID=290746 RepID=A0A914E924_9BILA
MISINILDARRKLKILINSPNVGYSHLQFQGKLADTLVEAGHDVHILIPMWNQVDYTNGTKKVQRVLRYSTITPTLYHEIHWVTAPFDSNQMDPKVLNKMLNFTGQFCIGS